ncbi:hypothetical protein [Prevotella nigrescens]|uniref:hypothetical protein n=1 Tax=Prevotella nigrescens TaxID=28133 RepID=UPI0002184369|nr:hypothetical protein [Prevotella nigrescens]EGQ12272.1 hypothetical protein HMPREF9419_1892 [Prevotella nigrescens ATCC 33563]UAK29324.1 peptidase M26 [Prevotella nigrescens]WMS20981.1 peptidase M26 [Prevotella nigrescens]SUB96866.1 Uncharacterised protein [Prevotella nigrescens]
MKTKNLIERLSLFLLALVLTMPAWAQGSSEVSIGSVADWKAFCNRVKAGEPGLNAKLTRDVDLGEEIVMVGEEFKMYEGTFDGQNHTLTVNWDASFTNDVAPFAYVKDATIKNLRVKGHITGKKQLAGLIYTVHGNTTLSNCVSEVDIKGKSYLSGMIYRAENIAKVTFTDCVVKGALNSDATNNMAGFVYQMWGDCTFNNCLYLGTNNATAGNTFALGANATNCYYLNACGEEQGTQVTKAQLESGEVAYKLQAGRSENVWGQKLGTDNEPMLTAEAERHVYMVGFAYNGEVKATRYANKGGHVSLPTLQEALGTDYNPHHYYTGFAFANGFNETTPVEGNMTVAVTVNEKDCYEIGSKEDWKTFCDLVNDGQAGLDAKMTKDVALGEDIAKVGTSKSPYGGTFDGQNHTLTVNWDAGSANDVAPFGRVKGATIKNLRTEGAIRSDGYYLGGLIDEAYGENTITGCVSNVNITSSTVSNWCGTGGLISYISTDGRVTINDCLVTGDINATTDEGQKGMGGFVYANNGTCTMNNCLYAGTNNGNSNASRNGTFTTNTSTSATLTLNNCYYLNPCGNAQGTPITKEQLRSGEVAHLLQNGRSKTVWGQVLGTDHEPQLTDKIEKRVYKVKFIYNGRVKATRYANHGGTVGSLPTAQEFLGEAYNPANTYKLIFDGDFSASTPVNSDRTIDVVVAESCEISSKADWQAFCNRVNGGETAINAKLMNDVDLGEEITMAGTSRNYNGTFDGQGHTLTLNWNSQSGEVAPFKFVNNATIKNLRVKGKIKSDGRTLSALVCNAVGNVTLSGCVSEVDITSNYHGVCELAGMIAYVNDRAEVAITDCAVKGAFNSMAADKKGMAGFVYLQTGYCTLTNCLYAGTNNATAGSYTFGSNTIRKNCCYLNTCGTAQGERIVEKQLKNGEVAYKLQGDRTDACYWAQVLGETPSPYSEADKEKPNYVYYNKENNGWTCDDFRLTDGQSLPIGLDFTATKATYDRTLAAGKATLCLPYELPVQGFRAYTLADRQESRTAVHFKEVNGTLGAYRPYLLVADAPARLDGENLQVKADRSSIVLYSGEYAFSGAVQEVVNWWLSSAHAYILQADGLFHKVTSDNPSVTVPAYRAYISYNSHEGAKPLSIVFDGETTGIYGTADGATDGAADGAADGAVYNLQGQRVADRLDDSVRRQIPAGVYIVNGRKVIVK